MVNTSRTWGRHRDSGIEDIDIEAKALGYT